MSGRLFRSKAPRRSFARAALSAVLRSLLALVVVVGVLLVALFSFEQAILRPLAEYAVERVTGRVFRIEGELDAIAGRVVRLHAGRVSLANAGWGSAGTMLSIDELEVSLDLLDLLDGRYQFEDVVVSGAGLLFEKNSDGRSNWAMGTGSEQPEPAEASSIPRVVPVRHGQLSDIAITVIDPALARPLDIRLDRVIHAVETDRALRAKLDARVNDRPLSLEARIAVSGQANAEAGVEFVAEAVIEETRLSVDGAVDNVFAPEQVMLALTLASPEISRVAEILGLPAVLVGETELVARLTPTADQHQVEVAGHLGALEIDARTRLKALDRFDGFTVELKAQAPNLAAVVDLPGSRRVPARVFEIDSRLSLAGSRLEIDETRVVLGDIQLSASGVMRQFPNPAGTDLNLLFEGDNYLELVDLFEYSAPRGLKPGPFQVRADLEYSSLDSQTLAVDLKLVGLDARLTGELSGYPSFVGTRVDYRLTAGDAVFLQQWLAYPLPIDGAYALEGGVRRTATGFELGPSRLTLGENRIDVSGKVGNQLLLRDSDLSLRFEGPDLGKIVAWSGYGGFVPAGPATIDAAARTADDGVRVERFELRFDRSRIGASGLVTLQPGMPGSRVDLSVSAEDIADLVPPTFHGYLQSGQALSLTGSFATGDEYLAIDDLQARLGSVSLDASGRVSMTEPLRGASFSVDVQGSDLSAAVPARLIPYSLPAQPFTLAGGIGFDERGLALDEVNAVIGSEKLQISGSIPLDDPRQGLSLEFAASGNDMGILVPPEVYRHGVGDSPYELVAAVGLDDGVLALSQLKFASRRGGVSGDLSVSIDDPLGFGKFDLTAKGDNLASLLPALAGYSPPAEPFDLDARGAWSAARVTVERGTLAIDDSRIEVKGEVGLQAGQVTTGLVFSARGDSTDDLGNIEGLSFPEQAFQIDASLESDENRLYIPALEARVGDSELRGQFAYAFGDKPSIEIIVDSRLLNLASIVDDEVDSEENTEPAAADGKLIPDVPVPAKQLERINLVAEINIDELRLSRRTYKDIEIDASLRNGDLQVSRLRAKGVKGELIARFGATLEGDRIVTRGELEGKDIVLGNEEAVEQGNVYPEQDIYLVFDTAGASSQELAANLNGFAQIKGEDGRLNNSFALNVFGGFFGDVLSKVNPFVTREAYTAISCFAAYADIVDGVATINPGAVLQTDKIDIFGRGQIDLTTEKISLRFDTTPRKGIGVSLGDFINPFVGVGGTLARPRLGVDPENAMFEGGFAVATGGMSIVITNLYRSWFGSSDPCAEFAEQAEKLHPERRPE